MVTTKFLDVYVDYKMVESVMVPSKEHGIVMRKALLAKYKGHKVMVKSRTEVEVEIVSQCEGGVCPIRTK